MIRVLFIAILFMLSGVSSAFASGLTLEEALSLAKIKDPALEQLEAGANALDNKAIAAGQLNDPKVKFALQSFPTNDFSYTREGMTQVVAGISQAFPRGKTLRYKSKKVEAAANVERARYQDKSAQIKLAVEQAWFNIYYWQEAAKTVDESELLLRKVIEATEAAFSTGRQNTQDIIGAELELTVLEDKRIDINRQIETAKAQLGKWIGAENVKRKVSSKFPKLSDIRSYDTIRHSLVNHPKIKVADAMLDASSQDVKIAKEQYKPGFNVGLNYGKRGGNLANGDDRPDMVTALVTLDMPLFTGKRQDKKLASSKYAKASANFMRDDALRNLNTMLETDYANWKRLSERANHYRVHVIKRAEENFTASIRAYQEDLTDFSSLIRSQVMELDTKLQGKKLKTDAAKAQARLLYLQGEN